MEGKFDKEQYEDQTIDNMVDSPLAEEDYVPSPKRSRRANQKKVVTVAISDGGDGTRSKTEVYPPPDNWTWRKYGQKPIKGSPYPRGYYRCSSSKGCPARKQVERSRDDPTTLLITYHCDHNHNHPTTTKNQHHQQTSSMSNSVSIPESATAAPEASFPPEESAAIANQPDIEPEANTFADIAGEFGWLCDVGSTMMNGTTLVASAWADVKVEGLMPIGEEDKLLFGDLGDLPESSSVFRRCGIETPCCGGTG